MRFHHTMKNGMPFKTYELFISGTFHLLFLDHSRLQVTEALESKTSDKAFTELGVRGHADLMLTWNQVSVPAFPTSTLSL